MKRQAHWALTGSALIALSLASCGTSSTLVIEQPQRLTYEPHQPRAVPASFTIRATPIAQVPQEDTAAFEERLRRKLERAGINDLVIEYHFLHAGTDQQLDRWFSGGSDRRAVTVDVVFESQDQERLAHIQVQGRTDPGLFGGSFRHALDRAADEIAEFAIAAFGN